MKVLPVKKDDGAGIQMVTTKTPLGDFATQQVCNTCKGEGETIQVDDYCSACKGRGRTQRTKTVRINVPAGVQDGNKLRVKGEGDAGDKAGPEGDLYIFLKVQPDPRFRRDGNDIWGEASVSCVDAMLGASITVPTVDGDVCINVPPGTQPGQVMRVKGKGATKLGDNGGGGKTATPLKNRGDHYVTVNVEIPTSLSVEERALVEKLRNEAAEKAKSIGEKDEKKKKKT
jgi:molecular chaperone DnaJ